jgi:hypothetical protein
MGFHIVKIAVNLPAQINKKQLFVENCIRLNNNRGFPETLPSSKVPPFFEGPLTDPSPTPPMEPNPI